MSKHTTQDDPQEKRPPRKKGPKPSPPEQRFWAKVNKDGPIHPILKTRCWTWTGGGHISGYGQFHDGVKQITAHRFSYELHYGPIQDGLWVCHHCDNPACVNPEHLFAGTRQDNIDDMWAKGRGRKGHHPVGERNPAAKLTAQDVLAIRDLADRRVMYQRDIAAKFGVSVPLIQKIVARKNWAHI